MNDFDLESKLKAWRVPGRDEEYWSEFPQRVLAKSRETVPERPIPYFFMPRLAMACLAATFFIWHSGLTRSLSRDERQLRASLVRLPDNMSRLMQDEHGLHYLIEETQ